MLKMNFKGDFGCGIRKAYVLQGLSGKTTLKQVVFQHIFNSPIYSRRLATKDMFDSH